MRYFLLQAHTCPHFDRQKDTVFLRNLGWSVNNFFPRPPLLKTGCLYHPLHTIAMKGKQVSASNSFLQAIFIFLLLFQYECAKQIV